MSWHRFFRRKRSDAYLVKEIENYITEEMAENRLRGMSEEEAKRRARIKFGNPQRIREDLWQQNSISVIESFLRDLNYALRCLARSPGFTLTAVLTLGLGLSANTAVFSLMNGLLLRPLPVPRSEQLAILKWTWSHDPGPNYSFSAPVFRSLEKRNDFFETVAGFTWSIFQVRGTDSTVDVPGSMVSGQFFQGMETAPLLGRYLTPQDDQPGGASTGFAVVISEGFWRSWFNGASDVIGHRLTIANEPFTVVGVMPKHFFGADPTRPAEIFAPLSAEPILDAPYNNTARGYHSLWMRIIARRNPGVSLEKANASLRAATNSILDESIPDAKWIQTARTRHYLLGADPGSTGYSYMRAVFVKPLVAVFCLCVAMLLLACLNLASLLMARSHARERELATRLALGASRRRLVQQLMTESLLIALAGTLAGSIVAPVISRSLSVMILANQRTAVLDTSVDLRVFSFVAIAVLFTTVLIGLVPAVRATSKELNEQIKSGSQVAETREKRGVVPRILMGFEVALALILVIGAGLLTTSLTRLYRTGLGFDPDNVANIDLNMNKQGRDGGALVRWYQAYGDALGHLPGVENVSFAAVIPCTGNWWTSDVTVPGRGESPEMYFNAVAPNYFRTMRIPMFAGRDFGWNDTLSSGRKIILNQIAARSLFPGQNPIGKSVEIDNNPYQIIAVVGNIRYTSVQTPAPAEVYLSITQSEDHKPSYNAVVRLAGPVAPLAAAARAITARMAPDIPAPVLFTMSSDLNASLSSERIMSFLAIFFAACALIVTGIGLYGTLAYATARRTKEIGIRIALGARRLQVIGMIFRENALIAISGSILGLILALLTARFLASFLYETSARDPWVLLASVTLLVLIASAASVVPSIRAARLDPTQALRTE